MQVSFPDPAKCPGTSFSTLDPAEQQQYDKPQVSQSAAIQDHSNSETQDGISHMLLLVSTISRRQEWEL